MQQRLVERIRRKEEVKLGAFEIIEKQGYVLPHDVSDALEIPLFSATSYLLLNYKQWNLVRTRVKVLMHGYLLGQEVLVYSDDIKSMPKKVELGKYKMHQLPI